MNVSAKSYGIAVLTAALALSVGCARKPAETSAVEAYIPGLGEIMTATQMRHTKLWFAGQAGNWPLADYELDELQEGFDDAVKYHPIHKEAPLPIAELLPKIMAAPLKQLRETVAAKDATKFAESFDALTGACNACHQEEKFEFNVVMRPTSNPYTNQNFESAPNQVSPTK